jgi:hypothetical protein
MKGFLHSHSRRFWVVAALLFAATTAHSAAPVFNDDESSADYIVEHVVTSAKQKGQSNASAAHYRKYARKLAKTLAKLDAASQQRVLSPR